MTLPFPGLPGFTSSVQSEISSIFVALMYFLNFWWGCLVDGETGCFGLFLPWQLQPATVFGGKRRCAQQKRNGIIWKTPLCLSGWQMDVAGDYQTQPRSQRWGGGDSLGCSSHTVPCWTRHWHSWAQLAPRGRSICRAGTENWRWIQCCSVADIKGVSASLYPQIGGKYFALCHGALLPSSASPSVSLMNSCLFVTVWFSSHRGLIY